MIGAGLRTEDLYVYGFDCDSNRQRYCRRRDNEAPINATKSPLTFRQGEGVHTQSLSVRACCFPDLSLSRDVKEDLLSLFEGSCLPYFLVRTTEQSFLVTHPCRCQPGPDCALYFEQNFKMHITMLDLVQSPLVKIDYYRGRTAHS